MQYYILKFDYMNINFIQKKMLVCDNKRSVKGPNRRHLNTNFILLWPSRLNTSFLKLVDSLTFFTKHSLLLAGFRDIRTLLYFNFKIMKYWLKSTCLHLTYKNKKIWYDCIISLFSMWLTDILLLSFVAVYHFFLCT
jgi:hypothetical protein